MIVYMTSDRTSYAANAKEWRIHLASRTSWTCVMFVLIKFEPITRLNVDIWSSTGERITLRIRNFWVWDWGNTSCVMMTKWPVRCVSRSRVKSTWVLIKKTAIASSFGVDNLQTPMDIPYRLSGPSTVLTLSQWSWSMRYIYRPMAPVTRVLRIMI